jgi:hypothetical protein
MSVVWSLLGENRTLPMLCNSAATQRGTRGFWKVIAVLSN